MSMNNIKADCWLFYLIRKRCNHASINQWLKWTHGFQLSLSGHLTSSPPSLSVITNHQDIHSSHPPQSVQPGSIWEGASHVSSMKRVMNLPLMDTCHMLCPQMWREQGGGFHTDRINMWEWLTSLYVSDVLRVLYISWEAFSKDMINLQNMVNFPSVGYSWLSASFGLFGLPLHCLHACSVCVCVHACVRSCVHACKHMSACVSPLCNHLHDGLIGLAAKGPKASAA